jgi:two-component system LytT family response regulator
MTIRTLVVDDEPLGRERIAMLLAEEPDVEVVGQCGDGPTALQAIRETAPHLVFLDVQMPERDGFEVMADLGGERLPLVIFVTAYDNYALRAFEVRALDYLLKPFDRARFRLALDRARHEVALVEAEDIARRVIAFASDRSAPEAGGHAERLVVKTGGRVFFLKAREIDWVEAAGNYLRLHVGADAHMIRQTMSGIEEQLDPKVFFRIHRSQIVNIDRVKELRPLFNGEYEVVLRTGARLTLSRTYRDKVQARLGSSF